MNIHPLPIRALVGPLWVAYHWVKGSLAQIDKPPVPTRENHPVSFFGPDKSEPCEKAFI